MEPRHGTACNGNKEEREQAAFPHRPRAIGELSQRRHFQLGHSDENPDGKCENRANFEECGQVVTRCQDQPDGQHRSDEAVANQHPGDLNTGEGKSLGPNWVSSNLPPQPN